MLVPYLHLVTHTHFIRQSHNGSLAAVLICIPLHEREWWNHLVVDTVIFRLVQILRIQTILDSYYFIPWLVRVSNSLMVRSDNARPHLRHSEELAPCLSSPCITKVGINGRSRKRHYHSLNKLTWGPSGVHPGTSWLPRNQRLAFVSADLKTLTYLFVEPSFT